MKNTKKFFKVGDPCYYVEYFEDKIEEGNVVACKFDFKHFMWKYIVDRGANQPREVYGFECGFKAHKTIESAKQRVAEETYSQIKYLITQAKLASESYNDHCSRLNKVMKKLSLDDNTVKEIQEYINSSHIAPQCPNYSKIESIINEKYRG